MTRKSIVSAALAVLLGCGGASTAFAQAQEVRIAKLATYHHDRTGVEFPPTFDGMKRLKVMRFGSDYDVSAEYHDDASDTYVSIYVTRVAVPDASLWFDRVVRAVTKREGFEPEPGSDLTPVFFTAPGFDRPSGIKLSYPVHGPRVASSGVALIAYGDWLVKVRVSSLKLEQPELDKAIDAAIAALTMPKPTGTEAMPYLVANCPDTLAFSAKAKMLPATSEAAITASLFSISTDLQNGDGKDGTNKAIEQLTVKEPYCYDVQASAEMPVYRPGNAHNSYLIAPNDAYRSVRVGLLSLLNITGKNQNFDVAYDKPDESVFFRPFNKLPAPGLVLDSLTNGNVIATSDRDKRITIVAPDKK